MEEVVVEEGSEGYQRLSISGWFHSAQPGEPGYAEEDKNLNLKSTREQLVRRPHSFSSAVQSAYTRIPLFSSSDSIQPHHL